MGPLSDAQVGRYQLVRPLAQGGMAQLYLAKQVGPGGFEKTVAVKRVLPHLAQDAELVRMFLDEARLAARLNHPNVVQVFDFGEADGHYYLAMEYLEGRDVSSLLRQLREENEPMPAQVAALIAAGAADGLHHAHTLCDDDGNPLHIVHRDISPSNLFVTSQGVVKVLDFGIARAEGRLVKTQTGTLKGKVPYMSPEQLHSRPLDGRSDVYALGATLHEMLTGRRLFKRETDAATLRAAMGDPIPPVRSLRPDCPEELEAITHKALQRDLSRRYASAQALHDALDDYLAGCTYAPSQKVLASYLAELERRHGQDGGQRATQLTPSGGRSRSRPRAEPGPVPPEPAPRPSTPSLAPLDEPPDPAEGRPTATMHPPGRAGSRAEPPPPSGTARPGAGRWVAGAVLLLLAVGTGAGVALVLARSDGGGPPAPDGRQDEGPLKVVAQVDTEPLDGAADAGAALEEPGPDAGEPAGAVAVQPSDPPAERDAGAARPARPPPARVLLDVNCVPWCRIYVDGRDTGRTSPAFGIPLTPGRHQLRLVNPPTGLEMEREVVARPGQTLREVVRF